MIQKAGPEGSASLPSPDQEMGEWIEEPPSPVVARRGRPTARSREEVLCHVWRLVYREMQLSGHTNVSRACRQIMRAQSHAGRRLIFNDEKGELLQRVTEWGTLRKWHRDAERLLESSGPYSMIAQFVLLTKRDVAALRARRTSRQADL